MSEYQASINWSRKNNERFTDNKYHREHLWTFDGGISVKASSSPNVVPIPYSNENAIDPEEAFVAAVSSCHMLWFLSIAAKKNIIINSYEDSAIGIMSRNTTKKLAISDIYLNPKITTNHTIKKEVLKELHHQAHENCFIASSILSKIHINQGESSKV